MGEVIWRYGRQWDTSEWSDLSIELGAFKKGITVDEGGLGKVEHFWNCVEMLWGYEGCPEPFTRTPWAERMAEEACNNVYLGMAGCASSGKSGFCAVWGIVNFLCAPRYTKVFMTSTSLKDSRNRIWGSVVRFWNALKPECQVGKLVDSIGAIRFINEKGKPEDVAGLQLLACEQKKEKDAIGKLVGFKNKHIILIADELPELTEAILEAFTSNLTSNPKHQFIGLGNPNSYYDPFGKFCEPKDGWKSISENSEYWETRYGICIRFDAEKSPNILAGYTKYSWMPRAEWIEEQKERLGPNSPGYWRMVRGYWCPTGTEDAIFNELEIETCGSKLPAVWTNQPTLVAALDPSFTLGGDRIPLQFGYVGEDKDLGQTVLQLTERIVLHEDTTSPLPRNIQIAIKFRDECVARGVQPEHAALDTTGGGQPFADIVSEKWSSKVLQVPFGGAPPDRAVSNTDATPCRTRYKDKVSYLWFTMVILLREGKLKGLDADVIRELCARKYTVYKPSYHESDTTGVCYEVESKLKMKARFGRSPDLADCLAILTELAVTRFDMVPRVGVFGGSSFEDWEKFVEQADSIYESVNFSNSGLDHFGFQY